MIIFTPNTVIRSTEVNSNFADGVDIGKHTNNYKFLAYANGSFNTTPNNWAKVQCNAELYDTNNNYDNINYKYTVPITGYYHFDLTALFFGQNGTPVLIGIGRNWSSGNETYRLMEIPNCGGNTTLSGSLDINLTAGDTITPLLYAQATLAVGGNVTYTRFNGHFISL